jgi:hypothetical protein
MSMTEAERAAGAVYRKAKARERKASTAARPKSPKADRGRERDNGYLAYLRRQPCAAAGFGFCGGPIQAAHVSYRVAGIANSFGRGVKNHDRHANPLCAEHHGMQHGGSEKAFWAATGKDAYETAAAHYAAYLGTDAGSLPVSPSGYDGAAGMNQNNQPKDQPHDQ